MYRRRNRGKLIVLAVVVAAIFIMALYAIDYRRSLQSSDAHASTVAAELEATARATLSQ